MKPSPILFLALLSAFSTPIAFAERCTFDHEAQRKKILGSLSSDKLREYTMLSQREQLEWLEQQRIHDNADLPQSRLVTESKLQEIKHKIRTLKSDEYRACSVDSDCVAVEYYWECGRSYEVTNKKVEAPLNELFHLECTHARQLSHFKVIDNDKFEFNSCGYAEPKSPPAMKCALNFEKAKVCQKAR